MSDILADDVKVVKRTIPCLTCGGRGHQNNPVLTCHQCDGFGRIDTKLSAEEFVYAIGELFDNFVDEWEPTPEEVDEVLREAGYDPEEVGRWGQKIADEELAKAWAKMKAEGVVDGQQ